MKIRVAVLALVLCLGGSHLRAETVLAQYQFASAGWATFGLALAPGEAIDSVRIGTLPVQTDVKRRWPDGSIRFAVVTARVNQAGTYAVTAGGVQSRLGISTAVPNVAVTLSIGTASYTATLPATAATDLWLGDGPLVREYRAVVAPAANGQLHPALRVIFDVRQYNDESARIDIAVTNTLNVAETNVVTYDVAVKVNGTARFTQAAVTQPAFTRWRYTLASGPTAIASILPDPSPFIRARALPKFLPTISMSAAGGGTTWKTDGIGFGILERGDLVPAMEQTGGRFELGCFPDYVAQFVVAPSLNRFDAIRYYGGNPSGYWGVHITERDGQSLVSLDQKPDFWFDYDRRYPAADGVRGPANNMAGVGKSGDPAHYPSLAYVPYLLTGDRWFADELRQTANFLLLKWAWQRQGSLAYYSNGQQIRGIAWTTRTLADAAAWLPDADPARAYFDQKLNNNLANLDALATASRDPLGAVEAQFNAASVTPQIGMWQVAYLVWSIDYAHRQGFEAYGWSHLRKWLAYQNELFNGNPGYDRRYGMPYYLHARRDDGTFFSANGWGQLWDYNFGGSQPRHALVDMATNYGAEAWLAMRLVVAVGGFANAQVNHDYVMNYTSGTASVKSLANRYPRFAVDMSTLGTSTSTTTSSGPSAKAPKPPRNPRIVGGG